MVNTPEVELWPANLLRARSNRDARTIAGATHVLRRKLDGRYLAAAVRGGLMPLATQMYDQADFNTALDAWRYAVTCSRAQRQRAQHLEPRHLDQRLDALGIDAEDYRSRTDLRLICEPSRLHWAGRDRYSRPLWLLSPVAQAWQRMRRAARNDGVALDAISGYRSHDYQLAIFQRKLASGQRIDAILRVNAAPGFSEHHSGRALDLGTPGEPPAEPSFELTAAFRWLGSEAGKHDFRMSYPRDNAHGIVFEPWHWCWIPNGGR